jgi:hypothetical protein
MEALDICNVLKLDCSVSYICLNSELHCSLAINGKPFLSYE